MLSICNQKELLNELKCKKCLKILSVLPVYYCSAVGNICGRCADTVEWIIANGNLERAVAYEAVAKVLLFPCHNYNQGCNAELKHTEIVQHEQECKSVFIQCPFNQPFKNSSSKCEWRGVLNNLAQHLKNNHKNFSQNGVSSFIINVHKTNIKVFFTTQYEKTFLVVTQYHKNDNKFYCTVICCEEEPENLHYRYQLEVGRSNDYFLILCKPETVAYCGVMTIANNQDKRIEVNMSLVQTMMNGPINFIHCKISIYKKTSEEISALAATKNPKPKVSQNHEAQAIPKKLFVDEAKTLSNTKLAEKGSGRSTIKCPLKLIVSCNNKRGFVDLTRHLREKHASYLVETNQLYSRELEDKDTTSYWPTTFDNEIFMICCKHDNATGQVKFNILHVGENKNNPKYNFDMLFCDQTRNGLKLLISQLCQVFPSKLETAFDNCLALHLDTLQPFIVKKKTSKIFFKFSIKKL